MSYENKEELYEAFKRMKKAYIYADDFSIRLSACIMETNIKSPRIKPENTIYFSYRKSIYKVERRYKGNKYIYYFEGLAPAILFMVKGQFEQNSI